MYNERPAAPSVRDENAIKLEEHISRIMGSMLDFCKEQIFGRPLLIFLGRICSNGEFTPPDYHFEFEINRLGNFFFSKRIEFNFWGANKNMDKLKKRMIIVFFIVFHTMLPRVLTKPWIYDPAIQSTKVLNLNLRLVASIIYHFFIDYFRQIEIVPNNQNHLPVELRNKPRKTPYKLDDRFIPKPKKLKPGEESELYEDVFSKEEMKEVFLIKKAKFEKCKGLVEQFIERVEDIVSRTFEVKNAERIKEQQEISEEERAKILKILKRKKIEI